MASSKDVFEPHTYGATAFAAGAFRGLGSGSAPQPRFPAGGRLWRAGSVGQVTRRGPEGNIRRSGSVGHVRN